MADTIAFDAWHIPLSDRSMTLRGAAALLDKVGAMPDEIPLMVRLAENPQFDLFTGAVDLKTHDYIHPLLGRGLLAKDEAFVVGFTMGSTHDLGAAEEKLFTLVAQYLYPGIFRFSEEDVRVFRDAVRLAVISDCKALNTVDYQPYLDCSLVEIRHALGIEEEFLRAYYAIERKRYPRSPESRRLLDQP